MSPGRAQSSFLSQMMFLLPMRVSQGISHVTSMTECVTLLRNPRRKVGLKLTRHVPIGACPRRFDSLGKLNM